MKNDGKMKGKNNKTASTEYIIKNKEKLLKQRKRKKRIKRNIILLTLLIIVLCTLAIKLPYFNISNFKVRGNKNLTMEYIDSIYKQFKGQNIFLFNEKLFNQKLKQNQYVEKIDIKRALPNSLNIIVEERRAGFYIKGKGSYYTMDSNGNILEKKIELVNKELVQILGFNESSLKNNKLVMNDRQRNILKNFDELCKNNNSSVNFDGINFSNIASIDVRVKNLTINIGMEYDMKSKLNKAINIIIAHNILNKSGYIDVSFNGNPVVNVN